MPRLLLSCLALLLVSAAAQAQDYDGWWPDPYEVAAEEPARRDSQFELTPEQARAIHEYLNRHADTNGDGVFNASDIQQFDRTGDLSLLRDSELMGGYFGSGDEFIRDGVEHEVNGGRFLRGSRDRDEDGERVARLDLFGMRGFLSDEGTYSNPSESVASSQFLHWRSQVASLLPGYIPPADYTAVLERIEAEQREASREEEAPRRRVVEDDDDPTVWW